MFALEQRSGAGLRRDGFLQTFSTSVETQMGSRDRVLEPERKTARSPRGKGVGRDPRGGTLFALLTSTLNRKSDITGKVETFCSVRQTSPHRINQPTGRLS